MPHRTRHLVTGATGFVGGALVLELLRRTDDVVLALVRPGEEGAEYRLRAALAAAATAYGSDPTTLPWDRVLAVSGDVTERHCGNTVARFDVLWHSAASLKYEDRFRDEIFRTNVEGTENVLAFARHAGARELNMISTAYVAGQAGGWIAETLAPAGQPNNHYERSKIEAEARVQACDWARVRILRPSIVVGHSETLAATTFSGLYGFVRQMRQFRGVMERLQKGLLTHRPLRMRVSPDMELNIIPVDEVAVQAVCIGTHPDTQGVYHLTQRASPRVGDAVRTITRRLGFADPEFVGPDEPLEWLDEQLSGRMDFYGSYIQGDKRFDRSRADEALGPDPSLRRALPEVAALAEWYDARLAAERQALPAAR